jgi:phytoene synthase
MPRQRSLLTPLEEPYRTRAVPPGSARSWSWLFAAQAAREPLIGIYALAAEWRALLDAGTDAGVAQIKLVWWRDEIRRLAGGAPLHPITRHLAALPHASSACFAELEAALEAVAAEAGGVPVERAGDLEGHADALHGIAQRVAARLGEPRADSPGLLACTAALAAGEYLARALGDYRSEARRGRIPFPVDELLAAGIDNDDLAATVPSPHVAGYLENLRRTAAGHFSTAAAALDPRERPALRHLAVLARLGARHLQAGRSPSVADFRFADLYNAWSTARRAAVRR